MKLKGNYYHQKFHALEEGDEIQKRNPSNTNEILWKVNLRQSDLSKVLESARHGRDVWRKTPLSERIECLYRYKEALTQRKDDIAKTIALETGKPLWESMTEAQALMAKVDVTINESLKRVENESIENVLPGIKGHTIYRPLGISLVIGPFNFPCHLPNGQIVSALLTGNSLIFKPSEKTMASSSLMFECLAQANFPSGVVNLLLADGPMTAELLREKDIKAVYFTGSLAVGKKILDVTYHDLSKVVALELGGKNSTILHKDTNIEHALSEVLRACFLSSGQRCTSTSTILVHKDIEQEFIDRFVSVTKKIHVDHALSEKEPFMGPLIDEMAQESYLRYAKQGRDSGSQELISAKTLERAHPGHYVSPNIHYLEKINPQNAFCTDEIFAPTVSITPYTDIDEALALANISDYGLAASLFTQDHHLYEKALLELEAGIINFNRSTVGASSRLPFGGLKNSGNHHPAGVSMIDHTVSPVASLETLDQSSTLDQVKGLYDE